MKNTRYMGGVGKPLIEVPAPEEANAVPENVIPLRDTPEPELPATVEYVRTREQRVREQSK